jgi:hypothetical protein
MKICYYIIISYLTLKVYAELFLYYTETRKGFKSYYTTQKNINVLGPCFLKEYPYNLMFLCVAIRGDHRSNNTKSHMRKRCPRYLSLKVCDSRQF